MSHRIGNLATDSFQTSLMTESQRGLGRSKRTSLQRALARIARLLRAGRLAADVMGVVSSTEVRRAMCMKTVE